MATGVIVASAFTKIVTSLTNNVFLPLVNYLVYLITDGKDVLLISVLNGQPYFLETVDDAGVVTTSVNPECIFIDWGIVLEAIVNFILIAAIIFIIVRTLIWGDPVGGWPSLVCIICLVSGVQLLCLGIVGQYLSKTYMEVKRRPIYLVKEEF